MGTSILGIGVTALNAAQAGIATTSHNIANASTPGYSRQETVQSTSLSMQTGSGFFGQGVQVDTVKRIYSDFLARQVTDALSASSELDTFHAQASQIDNMLADTTTGLSPSMQDFFSGVNAVANNPSDIPSRQTMLSSAQSMVSKFQTMQSQLDQLRQGTETQIGASVDTINSYASQLASLNQAIANAENSANGQPANDLRDQRNQLINDLSQQVNVKVLQQSDGTYNVYIGSGQALVVGNQAASLTAVPSPADASRLQVSYQMNGVNSLLRESDLSGGTLGGLLSFRSGMLDTAQNSLGRIALAIAGTTNAQHRLGLDLNGEPGGDFFTIAPPTVIANSANGGSAQVNVAYSDFSALTTSDYRVSYDGSNYTLTRLSDGTATSSATLPMSVDGFNVSLSSGSMLAGDSFLIEPTRNGAGAISVAVTDPANIAAAAPITTSAPLSNAGTGSLSSGAVDASFAASSLPAMLTYSGATGMLSGFPAGASITLTNNGASTTYAPGSSVPFTAGASISFAGMSFTLAGSPANGDQFVISPNTGAVGDNRNALLLAGLQGQKTLSGNSSFADAYGQLVTQVGNKTREAEVAGQTQDKLLEEAQSSVQSLSGVNLDEEAANLLRYQQAYQAAGKVMQIAGKLFDTLLTLGN